MSVERAATASPATTSPGIGDGIEGLEDIETSDLVMPILRIDHQRGAIIDNLSGQEHTSLEVVLLGLIKQRVLWDAEVNEGDHPLCKAYDAREGHPDHKRFPWAASGFDPRTEGTLPCENCQLKEWGSHPNREVPWCSEQHTYPLLQVYEDGTLSGPSLFTVQRSAIKGSKAYISSFVKERKPLYVCRTRLTLDIRKRGSVPFAVPKFVRGAGTEEDDWPGFADQYRGIRDFVQTPRTDEVDPEDRPAGGAGSAAPAAAASSDEDDMPF
jgi:hypothetical protein